MSFKEISEAYFSGKDEDRKTTSLEYKNRFGKNIGSGATSLETTFVAFGNGNLEFHRRGDFMERGHVFPGIWNAHCDPRDLQTLWDKLGDLNQDSFPARLADPGDSVETISALYKNRLHSLTWGPPEPNETAPGDDFLAVMAPLIIQATKGEVSWAIEMKFSGIERVQAGVIVKIDFVNHGKIPIGIYLPRVNLNGGFALRYCPDRDVPAGVTRLPVEWTWVQMDIPKRQEDSLWVVQPGNPVSLSLKANPALEMNRKYLGKVQFEQTKYLDVLAGHRILSGSCYSNAFEFQT